MNRWAQIDRIFMGRWHFDVDLARWELGRCILTRLLKQLTLEVRNEGIVNDGWAGRPIAVVGNSGTSLEMFDRQWFAAIIGVQWRRNYPPLRSAYSMRTVSMIGRSGQSQCYGLHD